LSSWRCSPKWIRHPEPTGSRRATPPLQKFNIDRDIPHDDAKGAWQMAEHTRNIAENINDHEGQMHWARVVQALERQTGYRPPLETLEQISAE
ncbi:hypothetical protein VQ042_25585, partial [Aurantimonas sp. A2-1-M11]|uniref:hypothetical protein n=1 Tax=Aurantimonas sp. A2-1-M11 TaxID=3113712 RepID=UPI002F92F5DD